VICQDANAEEAALNPPGAGDREDPKFEDPEFQAKFVAAGKRRVAALRADDQTKAAALNDDFENGQTDVAAAAGGYGLAECQGLGY
jgi:hypothetical protein